MSADSNNPQHIAIVMDGNGRWANSRGLPRAAGHREGIRALRRIVEHCAAEKIQALTVYAFSSENWKRPAGEVSLLMELFLDALNEQVDDLHGHGVNIGFIGDLERFPEKLQHAIADAAALTSGNAGLKLRVAANYGGRWDIKNAFQTLFRRFSDAGAVIDDLTEGDIGQALSLSDLPEPDLFIRTGGEQRVSNFLLWQLAYTEMYFTDLFWPDFSPDELARACSWFAKRQRRFGRVSDQALENRRA